MILMIPCLNIVREDKQLEMNSKIETLKFFLLEYQKKNSELQSITDVKDTTKLSGNMITSLIRQASFSAKLKQMTIRWSKNGFNKNWSTGRNENFKNFRNKRTKNLCNQNVLQHFLIVWYVFMDSKIILFRNFDCIFQCFVEWCSSDWKCVAIGQHIEN